MSATRGTTILLLSLAVAAFTFGCGTDADGGAAGSGGDGGSAGSGGGGGGGEGGIGGEIAANFETSLHKTRAGQSFWYSAANNGFQSLVNVAYEDMTCQGCHNKNDPSWAGEATCADCHDSGGMGGAGGGGGMALPKHLDSNTCLGCHGRQNAEGKKIQGQDFHSLKNFSCANCHGDRNPDPAVVDANDVHGNGTEYDSMLQPGAIKARCNDCHTADGPGTVPPDNAYHSGMHDAVDCALCHTETVISCINCHLEDDVDNQTKCASGQVFNWKFVMKWDKEGDGNEVFHPATIMTVKYNCDRDANDVDCADQATDPKKTIAVFAPYYAHTVTQQAMDNITSTTGVPGAPSPGNLDGCAYCHSAANCVAITDSGMLNRLKLIEFEGTGGAGGSGGPTGRLFNPISGLIPVPEDYQNRFAVDFGEWQEGAGSGCPLPDGPPKPLVYFETGPDLWQTGVDTAADNNRQLGAPLNTAEFQEFCPPAP